MFSLCSLTYTHTPAGYDFLTLLGSHEGEGLALEAGGREGLAGSRSAAVSSRGQAVDMKIVEVALFFQGEVVRWGRGVGRGRWSGGAGRSGGGGGAGRGRRRERGPWACVLAHAHAKPCDALCQSSAAAALVEREAGGSGEGREWQGTRADLQLVMPYTSL